MLPHTEQLPKLLAALNKEFRDGLPDRLARADKRANGFDKLALHYATTMFCLLINASRSSAIPK